MRRLVSVLSALAVAASLVLVGKPALVVQASCTYVTENTQAVSFYATDNISHLQIIIDIKLLAFKDNCGHRYYRSSVSQRSGHNSHFHAAVRAYVCGASMGKWSQDVASSSAASIDSPAFTYPATCPDNDNGSWDGTATFSGPRADNMGWNGTYVTNASYTPTKTTLFLAETPPCTTDCGNVVTQYAMPLMVGTGANIPPCADCIPPIPPQNANVIHNPGVYNVFWGPEWQTGWLDDVNQCLYACPYGYGSAKFTTYVNTFFNSIGTEVTGTGLTSLFDDVTGAAQGASTYGGMCDGVQNHTSNATWGATVICGDVPGAAWEPYGGSGGERVHNSQHPDNHLLGTWIDTTPVPANAQVFPDMWDEVKRAEAHFGLPYSPDNIFAIYTPPGTFEGGFHGYVMDDAGNAVPWLHEAYEPNTNHPLPPFSCPPNCTFQANDAFGHGYYDAVGAGLVHEYFETIADPWLNNTYRGTPDPGEVADICEFGYALDAKITLKRLNGSTQWWWMRPLYNNDHYPDNLAGCYF